MKPRLELNFMTDFRFKCLVLRFLLVFFVVAGLRSAMAQETSLSDWVSFDSLSHFEQGALIRGQLKKPGRMMVLDRDLTLGPQGEFVFGLGRDHPHTVNITIVPQGGAPLVFSQPVSPRDYKIQRIEGIAKKYMSPDAEALQRIRKDSALVRQTRTKEIADLGFLSTFRWPVHGPITGVFGSQRFFNGEPRRPHYGIDIAAAKGTEVVAPAPGEVTMAHPDMYFSGATLIIDHGYGVSSTFLHLDSIRVKPGTKVALGDVIGTVGSSGRSTGAHLDWRLNWFDQKLDPANVVGPMPTQP